MLGKRSRPNQSSSRENRNNNNNATATDTATAFLRGNLNNLADLDSNPKLKPSTTAATATAAAAAFFNAPRIFIGFAPPKSPDFCNNNDGSRSPTSPLDVRRCFESKKPNSGGLGIGLLAALHAETLPKSSNVVSPKNSIAKLFKDFRQQQAPAAAAAAAAPFEASRPIPIIASPAQASVAGKRRYGRRDDESEDDEDEKFEEEDSESYTCVTKLGPTSVTRQVYIGGCDEIRAVSAAKKVAVFEASSFAEEPSFPNSDFLSTCFLCRRPLCLGKDIYMYRGDRAFCSVECRYQQIVSDEKKERCCVKQHHAAASPQQKSLYYQQHPKNLFTMAAA